MNDDETLSNSELRVIAEVGGTVDRSNVKIAIYGTDLIPEEITSLIGVQPTESFRRGYVRSPRSYPTRHGAWFLESRGLAPDGPDVQLRTVLAQVPTSKEVWEKIAENHTIQIRFGIHMSGWNKGFGLPKELLSQLAAINADLEFDIYTYGDDEA